MANIFLPPVIIIPSTLLITGISNSYPMVVTFTVPSSGSNTYVVNQLVRLFVPNSYKMLQANGLTGKILSVGDTSMTLDINSSLFDVFTVPSGNAQQPASLAPAGSQNLEFNNTSAQVGFEPLNNIGN